METSAIAYRVADFLKQYPPFESIDDADLRELAAGGRVRFFEPNEFILWQGEPHKPYVFVIQQGTVSLWDDSPSGSALRDVRGAGDLLGIERFSDAPCCLYSATSSSDVVIYALRGEDFERLVLSHASARRFVEAYDTVAGAIYFPHQRARTATHRRADPAACTRVETCASSASLRQVAHLLITSGADAVALLEADGSLRGIVTPDTIVEWVGRGHDVDEPAGRALASPSPAVSATASVADAALAMAEHHDDGHHGHPGGTDEGLAIVTHRHIGRVFGDDPVSIIRELRLAPNRKALRELSVRVRGLALRYLSDSTSVEWIQRLVSMADGEVVKRLLTLDGADGQGACWCFCGTAGRGELLTMHTPELLVIGRDDASMTGLGRAVRADPRSARRVWLCVEKRDAVRRAIPRRQPRRVAVALQRLAARTGHHPDVSRAAALRPARRYGDATLWSSVEACVAEGVDPTFLLLLANDCLGNMPPLTFFQDAVLDTAGEQTTVFKLEESALRPLVDVGRVFGLATRRVVGTSTVERLRLAAALHQEHEYVFTEAAETFRILLRQQARIGISQGTTGSELPPSVLSRHDRQVLKSGFRSILALLEITRSAFWLESA